MNKAPILYGPTGEPITPQKSAPGAVRKSFAAYLSSLYGFETPFSLTSAARDPFEAHSWFYTAAMIRATNFAQASLTVFEETPEVLERRRVKSLAHTKQWFGPRSGSERTAIERHLSTKANPMRYWGFKLRGLEEVYEHPIAKLFRRPNPFLSQSSLIQLTSLWLSLRGECFWLGIMENGGPVPMGEIPDEIWVVPPEQFEPVIVKGRLLGWWFKCSERIPKGKGVGSRVPLLLHEVIQFKYPNPKDPYRGVSPITAASAAISMDLMSDHRNNKVLLNGSDPGGLLVYDGTLDELDREDFLSKWESRHRGPANTGRPAILEGAWRWVQTALSPKDMEYLESKRWNRETVFGILRVPKSVAGITEDLNYATQQGQDKNLWEKSLLPDGKLIEDVLDTTIMFDQPDNVVAAFDYSNVTALRAGLDERVQSAVRLMEDRPHMPPKVAFEMVGLFGVPEYLGDNTSLVQLNLAPVQYILEGSIPDEVDTTVIPPKPPPENMVKSSNPGAWKNFIAYQGPVESSMRRRWRSWARRMKEAQLQRFDEYTGTKDAVTDTILFPLETYQSTLGDDFRPEYIEALEQAYELFLTEVGGIAIFELDNPTLLAAIDRRVDLLKARPATSFYRNLQETVAASIAVGESMTQLRARIAQLFDIRMSSAKALQIARTESAGFMNTVREDMFRLQGFSEFDWITAGDEHVRPTHQFFGLLGPKPEGFNYLKADGYPGVGSGTLEFPGDPRASSEEVVSCRCVRVPIR